MTCPLWKGNQGGIGFASLPLLELPELAPGMAALSVMSVVNFVFAVV